MSSWARVGLACVCINDDFSRASMEAHGVVRQPMINEVLTISQVITEASGLVGLQFVEIPVTKSDNAWSVAMFRPLITKSQEDDISMFKSLLKPTEVPA